MFCGEPHQSCGIHRRHPLRIELEPGPVGIEDLEDLLFVGLRIGIDLVARQGGPCGTASRGIADQPGEIADQKDDFVAELLELPHLVQQYGVSEMKIRGRGIESGLDRQRSLLLEPVPELRLEHDLFGAAHQLRKLFRNRDQDLSPRHPALKRAGAGRSIEQPGRRVDCRSLNRVRFDLRRVPFEPALRDGFDIAQFARPNPYR